VNYGVAYEFAKFNNSSEFEQFSFATDSVIPISFSSAFDMHKYGAFAQVSKTLLEQRLVLSLGMRADGNEYSPEMANPLDQFSPRFLQVISSQET